MSHDTPQDNPNGASDPLTSVLNWAKKHWKALVAGIVAVFLVVVIPLATFSWINGINNRGYEWQRNTLSMYQGVQQSLGTCLGNTVIGAQVAQEERESLKDTLTGVISRRYPTDSQGKVDVQSAGVLITAVQEQYPTIPNDLFKQLMTNAVGCRNEFSGEMKDLQAYAGRFEIWAHQGGIFEKKVRNNWPNDLLKVTGMRGEVLTGAEAIVFLTTPITTQEAADAVLTHRLPNQELFPTPK